MASQGQKADRRIIHCLLCEKPQEMLSTHLARVCMKNNTPEERQAELLRAKESVKEWTREARNWDYSEMCKRYPHKPTRLALLEELQKREFFVANAPSPAGLEPSNEPQISAAATFSLLKQPKVLIRRLENCSSSVPVSSPPHSMVTPLRGNGLLRLKKDQVLTQKSGRISQSERPMKLLPFSSEIRMGAEVSLGSPVVSSREQNTGQTVESSQVFASSQCPFVHTEEVNLRQHIEKVHTEQLNRSLESQKSPSSTHQHPTPPKTLPTPTQSHTGTPGTHTCSHCGKSFALLANWRVHLRTHTGERPYSCSHCGKSFALLDSLKQHQRTHTGERPYPCSHCGKSFRYSNNLRVHLRTHTGARPYSCSHCGKSFVQSCALKRHLQTHTGERPYPCSHCGKSFAQLVNLKKHLRTHTGPYSVGRVLVTQLL